MVMFSFFAGYEQTKYLEISKKTEKDTLGTLGTTMAHEINSPLMALMTSLEKVEKNYDVSKNDLEKIHRAVEEIKFRVDQIESLSRNEIRKEKYSSTSENDIYIINKDKNKLS